MTLQPLKKNTAATLYLEVRAQADPTTFKSGPTIAAGDFKFSVDGGAYANLNTTPTASGAIITVALLAAETNGDVIKVKAEDVAGAEWVGRTWTFYTSTKQIDDLATAVDTDALPTNAELTTALNTLMTTALMESYAADGATMTPAQALYEIRGLLSEFSVSGVTMTVKKKDGSTAAATYTLDSAVTPTSITRST